MATLTYDSPLPDQNTIRNTQQFPITTASQLYIGELVMLTSGALVALAAASGTVCLGYVVEPGVPGGDPNMDAITAPNAIAVGNTALSVGVIPTAVVQTGESIINSVTLTIAGTLAGTVADVGKTLYAGAASANIADASTTQTSTDAKLGHIAGFVSKPTSTTAVYNIALLSFTERNGA